MNALSTDHSPVPTTDRAPELSLEREEMLREAEAIRRRIAENEGFLRAGPWASAVDETPDPRCARPPSHPRRVLHATCTEW